MKHAIERTRGCILLVGMVGVMTIEAAQPLRWIWRSQPITGNILYNIAGGPEVLVAVGRVGTIVRGSPDGLWSVVEADVPSHFDLGSVHLSTVQYRGRRRFGNCPQQPGRMDLET